MTNTTQESAKHQLPNYSDSPYKTMGELSAWLLQHHGKRTALDFESQQTSYSELHRISNRIARSLLKIGLTPGDHIGYLGKNSDFYFALLIACGKSGTILTPINWRLATPEVSYILSDAKAKVLFVGQEFLEVASDLKPQLADCDAYIQYESDDKNSAHQPLSAWLLSDTDDLDQAHISADDPVVQLYTSGTTGNPKGAMISHQNLIGLRYVANTVKADKWNLWDPEDVILVSMPEFHIGGTAWGLCALFAAAKTVITRDFIPDEVLDNFEEYGVTRLFLVPAAMQLVVNHPRARDVDYSKLKYMLYGASPIPLELLRTCMDVFGCEFVQMYGMTETSGTVCSLAPEEHDPDGNRRMRSAGKALDGVEIEIWDEHGKPMNAGETGEIVTRSSANTKGYWNLPQATQETITASGWLRTGDAGYLDEDGYVYIHDRVKDMIISGGENIYPAEVENAIFGCPGVADVGVVGVPNEQWGESVKAMVVVKPGASVSEADVIEHARSKIAGYKCPRSVDFISELPRNASGKILRRILREPFWADSDRAVN